MLFLKTVDNQFQSRGGFQWPRKIGAVIEAPDWDPAPECGGGLHGLRDGNGNAGLIEWDATAEWIAFESVDSNGDPSDEECIAIDGGQKWKCRRAKILAVGRKEATDYLVSKGCTGVHGATCAAGDDGAVIVGDYGVATSGDGGIAIAGNHGIAAVGAFGTATAGACGEATAGDDGTATVGERGTATVGKRGTAMAGYRGTTMAGEHGIIAITHWDGERTRVIVGYIGEYQLKPNTPYRLNKKGKFVQADKY